MAQQNFLYKPEVVQKMDRYLIDELKIDGYQLMCRAGSAAFSAILTHLPQKKSLLVFCGSGNNGGDGYVIARLAQQAGFEVTVQAVGNTEKLTGSALLAFKEAVKAQVKIISLQCSDELYGKNTASLLVIDALLGTGFHGKLHSSYKTAIGFINRLPCTRFSIDVPSGLDVNSGVCKEQAVKADYTITFIGNKQGLYTADGPDYAGQVIYDDLLSPAQLYQQYQPCAQLLTASQPIARHKNSHKGDYGKVLVVAGQRGMLGAGLLSSRAALGIGAGMATLATDPAHSDLIALKYPELMSVALEDLSELSTLLAASNAILLGPGLVKNSWCFKVIQSVLQKAIAESKMIVADAGALYYIQQAQLGYPNWVLTPHPGEAAMLLGCSTEEVQQDRFQAARALQKQYQGIIVLKGCGTLVADQNHIYVCPKGDPKMASAGMGDVLAGMIAGLLAQIREPLPATQMAVLRHAELGQNLAEQNKQKSVVMASDLIAEL